MSSRFPITLIRTALQMTATSSRGTIAEQVGCSRAAITNWRQTFEASGHTLADLQALSDIDLADLVFSPRSPKGFMPWRCDAELYDWFSSTNLTVCQFYKTVYLPLVPDGQEPVRLAYVYRHIHVEREKHPKSLEPVCAAANTVQCFDISDELVPTESAPLCRNQVRITLANGASIDFYPGSTSESFVGELLRQNGVKI